MKRIVARGTWKILVLGVVAWPWVGWAQRSEIYKQEIRALFKEGKAHAEKGRYQNAMMRFFAALDLLRRLKARKEASKDKKRLESSEINFFYFLGKMYALDKQQKEAIRYYRRCARHTPPIQAAKLCEKELKALGVESSKAAPSPRGEREKALGEEDSSPPLPPSQNSSQGGKGPTTLHPNQDKPLQGPRRVIPPTRPSPRPKLPTSVSPPKERVPLDPTEDIQWKPAKMTEKEKRPSEKKTEVPSTRTARQGVQGNPAPLEQSKKPFLSEERLTSKPPAWTPVVGWIFIAVGAAAALGGAAVFVARQPQAEKCWKNWGKGLLSTGAVNQLCGSSDAFAVGGWSAFGVAVVSVVVASVAFVKARPPGLPPTTKAEVHVQGGKTLLFERW